MSQGCLVLVVGPSGSGKDTLMLRAAALLGADERYRFARRVITRPPQAGDEDSDMMSLTDFAAAEAAGAFALSWEAHGLRYGIPAGIAADIANGRIVVANVSRGVIASAAGRFPVKVVEITAPPELRAARLASRGREDQAARAARMSRSIVLPPEVPVTHLVNDRGIEEGAAALRDHLAACLRAVTEGVAA